ncbi:hypothetical protein M0802_008434 [Mischocyttarus mexicanus]|nr:hypothetical protein M0802_008434 [Mischocyttarus mexicanus]
MGKVEINDEIVRMRKLVKQARVCVIRKLTRESKTLRAKKGNEKQLEKNKKKADKLINEIHYLKNIKIDNITKFGINNKKSLQEILQNKKSKISTRIMGRIVEHKLLKNAIIKFRETYPDYEEYLQPGINNSLKKNNNLEKQDQRKITESKVTLNSSEIVENLVANNLNSEDQDSNVETEMEDNVETESEDNNLFEEEESSEEKYDSEEGKSTLKIESKVPEKIEQKKSMKHLKRDRKEMTESIKEEYDNTNEKNVKKARITEISNTDKQKETIQVISKEATVKRLTEVLLEQNSEENDTSKTNDEKLSTNNQLESEPESQKIIDPFFVSGDGDAYLSLAPSIKSSNTLLNQNDNFYSNKFKQHSSSNKRPFANDRFFNNVKSSIDIRGKRKQEESRYNDNNFNRDKNVFKKQNNNNELSFRDGKNHNKNATVNANTNSNENLHPSWAAKKKQQEILNKGFQGKKIVFDDV